MKNKKIVISLIIIVVLILSIIGVSIVNGSSYNIIKKQYKNVTNVIDKSLNEYKKQIKDGVKQVTVQGDVKLNLGLNFNNESVDEKSRDIFNSLQNELNKATIGYTIKTDIENEYIGYNLKLLKDNSEVTEASFDLKSDTAYLKLKDTLEEYIKLDIGQNIFESIEENGNINTEDYDKLYKVAKKDIEKNIIKKDNVKTEKATVIMDGKEQKVKKNTLTIDNKAILNCEIDIFTHIKESKELTNSLINILKSAEKEYTEEEIKEVLEDAIKQAEENLKSNEEKKNFNIIVYTNGIFNQVVQYEIGINDKLICRVSVDSIKQKSGKIKLLIADTSGNINTTDNVEIEWSEEKEIATAKVSFNNSKIGKISLEITGKELKEKIAIPDFSNAKDASELKYEDLTKLQTKLSEIANKMLPEDILSLLDTVNLNDLSSLLSNLNTDDNNESSMDNWDYTEDEDIDTDWDYTIDEDTANKYLLNPSSIVIE